MACASNETTDEDGNETTTKESRSVRAEVRGDDHRPKTLAAWDKELKAKRDKADELYRTIKAELDAETSYYNIAVDEAAKYPPDSPRQQSPG